MTNTLIVDGNALLKLGFHGLKNLSYGDNHIGGVFHFLNKIRIEIDRNHYEKVVVFWDGKKNYTSRRKIYENYKIRKKSNFKDKEHQNSFYSQKQRLQQYLEEIFIRQTSFDNYEADDAIAFYCKNVKKENITILTNDRDLLQLISSKVNVRLFNRDELIVKGEKIKYEGFLIPIENIKLLKIICGDSSDGIKGIKGVGVKTVINNFPEVQEKVITLENFLKTLKEKYIKSTPNFRVKNLIKGITIEGELGDSFFERNKNLIDLTETLLDKNSQDEILDIIKETIDPEDRSYKNLLRMMMEDGLFKLLGKSDDAFLKFVTPFIVLTRIEKNKFKNS